MMVFIICGFGGCFYCFLMWIEELPEEYVKENEWGKG